MVTFIKFIGTALASGVLLKVKLCDRVCVWAGLWVVRRERVTGKGTYIHAHTHTEREVCLYWAQIARSVAILKTMPTISKHVCYRVCVFTSGRSTAATKQKYGLPDSQFDTKTRLKWPIIILRTYQKDFDMHMISECVKWTATLKKTISQSSLTGLRNIGTKSTKQKHKQTVNTKSSFLRHSA